MKQFEHVLDLFGSGEIREYARKALEVHDSSVVNLLGFGYFPEQAHFKTQFSGVSVEFEAWEILKFHQLRAAGIELVPVVVWAHPDRVVDMKFRTDNRIWVEYWTKRCSSVGD